MSTYYGIVRSTDSDIRHFGVLGMKWGIRRFQNKDGSLTAAGKDRYGSGNDARKTNNTEQIKPKESIFSKSVNADHPEWENNETDAQRMANNYKPDLNVISALKNGGSEYGTLEEKLNAITADCITQSSEDKRRNRQAADLGLAVHQKHSLHIGDDPAPDNMDDHRFWFIYEDQTIGEFTIADMVNRGYTAKQCRQLIKMCEDITDESFKMRREGKMSEKDAEKLYDNEVRFVLNENYNDSLGKFADECEKVLKEAKSSGKYYLNMYDYTDDRGWGHYRDANKEARSMKERVKHLVETGRSAEDMARWMGISKEEVLKIMKKP